VVVLADYRDGAGHILVDDGSCVAEITLTPKEAEGQPWREGMYVMVLGSYSGKESLPRANRPVIKVTSLILCVSLPSRFSHAYFFLYSIFILFFLSI
jgi:RecQ-mediated genome instability protein 2